MYRLHEQNPHTKDVLYFFNVATKKKTKYPLNVSIFKKKINMLEGIMQRVCIPLDLRFNGCGGIRRSHFDAKNKIYTQGYGSLLKSTSGVVGISPFIKLVQ